MRGHPGAAWGTAAARALAVALVLNELAFHVVGHLRDGLTARGDPPLHLTDAATIAAVIALWRPVPLAVELTYLWAVTATVQALLTPDLRQGFPDYRRWWFVVAHAGVVAAAVMLAWGAAARRGRARWRASPPGASASPPRRRSARRPTGGNYIFLRRPPAGGSLLDLLGPWPWYIGSAAVLAVALFWLLDRPFDAPRAAARGASG